MKYIVLVPDGMADWPIVDLGNKTPLEAAHTEHMDYAAQKGFTGMVKTIPDKLHPGSEIGNLSILGYDPVSCFTGRAPLEAANLGITLKDNEIAFRCNTVTLSNNTMMDYSAGHISTREAQTLMETLDKDLGPKYNIRFIAGKSYRHLMILKTTSPGAFTKVICVPPHDIIDQNITKFLPQGQEAKILNEIMTQANEILTAHPVNQVRIDLKENPANAIWLWGQGTHPQLTPFEEKYHLKGGIISAVDLINGIGKLAGLEVISVPGITGYYDTNYAGKAAYALKALRKKDFVFIHVEAPDEAGHNGDCRAKVKCIERIDREIAGPLIKYVEKKKDVRLLILPDHPTPVAKRTHSREPVGFVMFGGGLKQDGSPAFNEKWTKEKGLTFQSGPDLMDYFIKSSR